MNGPEIGCDSITISEIVLWLYVVTSTLLIVHQIDAAYWKEWRLFASLFKDDGKDTDDGRGHLSYVVFHLPLLPLFFYGLIELSRCSFAGLILSIILSVTGVLTFAIHAFFFGKGRREFRVPVSIAILISILLSSGIQLALTICLMF